LEILSKGGHFALRRMPPPLAPSPPAPLLPPLHSSLLLLLLLLLSAGLLPVHLSHLPDTGALRSFHAALQLSASAREAALQEVMHELRRSGCPLVLQAAALAYPPSHTVHMHAAFCSNASSARSHFLGALVLEPDNVESILAAAYHPSMSDHYQQLAVRLLARLLPSSARTGRHLYALAMAAAARGTFLLSSHYFSLAVGRGVRLLDVGDSWVQALSDGGRPLRALQLLLASRCCDARGGTGGEDDAAADWCSASAVHVGEALVAQGMPRLALQLLQCATGDGQQRPDVMTLSCSARAHRALGNIDAAAAEFSQALRLQPASADARRNVGMIMLEAGLLQQAEQHLRLCVLEDPHDTTALSSLATVCAKTGRPQEAEELFLAAAQLQPDSASIRSNLATFYRNNRLWGKAEALATQVLAQRPDACDMHAQLLQLHAQQSHPLPALRASARYVSCCSSGRTPCPDMQSALLSDTFFRRQLCDWRRWQEDARLLQHAASSPAFRSSSFSAIQASVFPVAPEIIRAFARRQAAEYERVRRAAAAAAAPQHSVEQHPAHILRIAFSFSDWFDHPVGDDALAAVAAAARHSPSTTYRQCQSRVFCISPSVPLSAQPVNSSHPCLQSPVEALFVAENSTEVPPPCLVRLAPTDCIVPAQVAAALLRSAKLHALLDFNGEAPPCQQEDASELA
jgi:Flp pilus assembly protein TadD